MHDFLPVTPHRWRDQPGCALVERTSAGQAVVDCYLTTRSDAYRYAGTLTAFLAEAQPVLQAFRRHR